MLRPLLAYARGADVDARWVVIPGNPDFFRVTKRIHNHLHGSPGDGGELGRGGAARSTSSRWRRARRSSRELVRPEDLVIVHDPQPAGLIGPVKERVGAAAIWRCHVGLDAPNDLARAAWRFLIPYVESADAYVFSRRQFGWEGLDPEKIEIIPPSIDAFSPKNQALTERPGAGHPGRGRSDGGRGAHHAELPARGRLSRAGRPPGRGLRGGPPAPRATVTSSRCRGGTG